MLGRGELSLPFRYAYGGLLAEPIADSDSSSWDKCRWQSMTNHVRFSCLLAQRWEGLFSGWPGRRISLQCFYTLIEERILFKTVIPAPQNERTARFWRFWENEEGRGEGTGPRSRLWRHPWTRP